MEQKDIDSTIWLTFIKGDKEAFAALYRLHSIPLIHYGLKISGDQEAVKDAIQDLFVELWNSREKLAAVESVKFYLFVALRYKLIRSEKKRYQRSPLSIIYSSPTFNPFENPVESIIIDKETHDRQVNTLHRALKSLTKRQQEVVQLRFFQGFSNDQIAALMNMNYQSVSNLMYSALSRIKETLKAPDFSFLLSAICFLFA